MVNQTLLDQELAKAELAWNDGNDGKARVCARRAVALRDRGVAGWSA